MQIGVDCQRALTQAMVTLYNGWANDAAADAFPAPGEESTVNTFLEVQGKLSGTPQTLDELLGLGTRALENRFRRAAVTVQTQADADACLRELSGGRAPSPVTSSTPTPESSSTPGSSPSADAGPTPTPSTPSAPSSASPSASSGANSTSTASKVVAMLIAIVQFCFLFG